MLYEQKGQILVEVIVALSILLVGALPLVGAMTGTARQLEITSRRLTAMELAQGQLEEIIGQNYAEIHTLEHHCFPDPYTDFRLAVEVNEPDVYGGKLKTICVTVFYVNPATGIPQKVVLYGCKADL